MQEENNYGEIIQEKSMTDEKVAEIAKMYGIKFTSYCIEKGWDHDVIHFLLTDNTIYKVRIG